MLHQHRILLAIVLMHVSWLYCHAQSQVHDSIGIATYNIRYANRGDGLDWWDYRSDAVIGYLQPLDVIGLQEVTDSQFTTLRGALADFHAYGLGRDDGVSGGERAAIFYRKKRFREIEKGTFWLSENPEQVGVAGWDAALPRTCTWIKLEEVREGKTFLVANTHFDHRGSLAREKSSQLIRRKLLELAGGISIVLMGDFNCTPDSSPYLGLTRGGHFLDARHVSKTLAVGPRSTWNGFDEIVSGRIIDHVFTSGDLAILQFFVDDPRTNEGRFASDHLPVRISIEFGKPAAR
jgi:endonuclease/exonuclease/phosphatase family metal-dependent hydrolase